MDIESLGHGAGLSYENFFTGLSQVSFIWEYFYRKIPMRFIAGFVGISQDKKTKALTPEIGWIVKRVKK